LKAIKRKDFATAVKDKRTDRKLDRKTVLNLAAGTNDEIDDRDPMDRVADELIQFTSAVQSMTQSQAGEVANMLKLLLAAIQKIGQQQEVKVNIADTRPKAWDVKVNGRNEKGRIESVRLVADG